MNAVSIAQACVLDALMPVVWSFSAFPVPAFPSCSLSGFSAPVGHSEGFQA